MARGGSGAKNRRMHDVKLSDGIITLSPLHLDDADAHLAGEDELLVRYLNGGPGTRQGVEAYIPFWLPPQESPRRSGRETGPGRLRALRADQRLEFDLVPAGAAGGRTAAADRRRKTKRPAPVQRNDLPQVFSSERTCMEGDLHMSKSAIAITGVAALAGAGLWAVPATAADSPATAYTNRGAYSVYYEGGGVNNNVTIERGEDFSQYAINDQVPIAVGDGCVHPDPADTTYVVCTLPDFRDYWTSVIVDLGEGSDSLLLRAGNENYVSGGPGNDTLDVNSVTISWGDEGNDWMVGGWRQLGGLGDDALRELSEDGSAYGNDGDDSFRGNSYGSVFYGGRGNDSFEALDGNDTVYGNSGEDYIVGGRGNDDLFGGPDNDVIYGNSGNDELHGGGGTDQLSGGPGDDTVVQD